MAEIEYRAKSTEGGRYGLRLASPSGATGYWPKPATPRQDVPTQLTLEYAPDEDSGKGL